MSDDLNRWVRVAGKTKIETEKALEFHQSGAWAWLPFSQCRNICRGVYDPHGCRDVSLEVRAWVATKNKLVFDEIALTAQEIKAKHDEELHALGQKWSASIKTRAEELLAVIRKELPMVTGFGHGTTVALFYGDDMAPIPYVGEDLEDEERNRYDIEDLRDWVEGAATGVDPKWTPKVSPACLSALKEVGVLLDLVVEETNRHLASLEVGS